MESNNTFGGFLIQCGNPLMLYSLDSGEVYDVLHTYALPLFRRRRSCSCELSILKRWRRTSQHKRQTHRVGLRPFENSICISYSLNQCTWPLSHWLLYHKKPPQSGGAKRTCVSRKPFCFISIQSAWNLKVRSRCKRYLYRKRLFWKRRSRQHKSGWEVFS